jgi:hypothetical protein
MFFLTTGPEEAARQAERNIAQLHNPRATYETTFRFRRHDGSNWQWVADTEVEEANGYAVLAGFTRAQGTTCGLIRDIFANPFRPALIDPAILRWNDGTVVKLARSSYDDRHLPEGTLDVARLAVLADALEEAGCNDPEILNHLRGLGPHVRGCWVVDLVLGYG